MNDKDLIAVVKFLVQLKAENLVLFDVLHRNSLWGAVSIQADIAAQREHLEKLPPVQYALAKNDLSQLPELLDTLLTARHL